MHLSKMLGAFSVVLGCVALVPAVAPVRAQSCVPGLGSPEPPRFAVGAYPSSVVAADLNGDGRPDLTTANGGSNQGPSDVSVLLGNGDGTFQAQLRFAVGPGPKSVVAADVNGDGRLDIATANSQSNDVSVLLWNGDGTIQTQVRLAVGLGIE